MAGDWIKAEHTLPDKPEVVAIAAILNIDQDAVVGKLLRLWIWADQQFKTDTILKRFCNGMTVSLSFIDRITLCPGFGEAMKSVGWLFGENGAFALPNFERHNGTTAKERASAYRRVKNSRARNGNDNADDTVAAYQKQATIETETELEKIQTQIARAKSELAELEKTPKRRPRSRQPVSNPTASDAIVSREINGNLLRYDDDPIVWEADFIREWNSLPGVARHERMELDTFERGMIVERLGEPDWFYRRAFSLFPLWTRSGIRHSLNQFLELGFVSKVLNHRYEKPENEGKPNGVSATTGKYDPDSVSNGVHLDG